MRYQIEFLPVALAQLRALTKDIRRLIGGKTDRMQDDLMADVKKLKGFKNKYRLRAGNGCILTLPRSAGLQPAFDVAWHLDSCEKADYKSALRYFAGAVSRCAPG